jgi:hypothetical protein
MLKKPVSIDIRRPWTFPLGRSLQACNPRWWRRRRIVEVSIALLSLMQDLQSHRGLSCAVLVGQSTFDEELSAVGSKLQRSLHAFGEQYSERQTVFRGAAWDHLVARWESLQGNWSNLDFHTNLTVHSELILGVVGILRHIGQDNVRSLQPDCVRVLGEWPTMVEHLGLLRAIGVHRLGHPGEPMESRLATLYRVHLHEARSTLARVADEFNAPALLEGCGRAVELAGDLRAGLPKGVDAPGYYAEMTNLIDAWYALMRQRLFSIC